MKCEECDGGRWIDASHGASRRCKTCDGTGRIEKEASVEDYLVEQVEARGGFCPKTVWLGRRGCPDREVVWPWGEIDKVETKRPKGGRYEPGQEQAHKQLAKLGVPVYLLNTKAKVKLYVDERVNKRNTPSLMRLHSVDLA